MSLERGGGKFLAAQRVAGRKEKIGKVTQWLAREKVGGKESRKFDRVKGGRISIERLSLSGGQGKPERRDPGGKSDVAGDKGWRDRMGKKQRKQSVDC